MIKIVAKMVVKEENIELFQEMAAELVAKSKAEEGNISYSLNRSLQDPKVFAFIEIWKDKDAIDHHNAAEHFTTILPKLAEMAAEPPAIDLYTEVQF